MDLVYGLGKEASSAVKVRLFVVIRLSAPNFEAWCVEIRGHLLDWRGLMAKRGQILFRISGSPPSRLPRLLVLV